MEGRTYPENQQVAHPIGASSLLTPNATPNNAARGNPSNHLMRRCQKTEGHPKSWFSFRAPFKHQQKEVQGQPAFVSLRLSLLLACCLGFLQALQHLREQYHHLPAAQSAPAISLGVPCLISANSWERVVQAVAEGLQSVICCWAEHTGTHWD